MIVRILILLAIIFGTSTVSVAKNFSTRLCSNEDRFNCYTVKKGDSWAKLFEDPDQRDLVMRLNRINIKLYPGMKIAIPKNLSTADKMDFAPFPNQITAPGTKLILVSLNPEVQAWGAYNPEGTLEHWGPVSGGKRWCPDIGRGCNTKIGKFAIYRKHGAGCKSSKFPVGKGGAPMPYCMFFSGGFALHGSHDVPGYNASHGCVRLFVPDAKWLNEEFVTDEQNVPVIIKNNI